jgi:hypothetical protein
MDESAPAKRKRPLNKRILRACIVCGEEFRGARRRCRACSATERECTKCGRIFKDITNQCRRCQAKRRACAACGREFMSTGGNRRCGKCQNTERCCVDCGCTFNGRLSRCGACRTGERQCSTCGQGFRGIGRRCSACQARRRDCADCGRSFKGTKSRCNTCLAIDRVCADCGRLFRGHQRRCITCQTVDRECMDCGRPFRGYARSCTSCRWLALPLEERLAKARRWHGRRRVRKLDAEIDDPVSAEIYASIMASGLCSYCGEIARTVDHIRPLARGGIEHESTCKRCNSSKGSKLLTEWLADRVARGVAACPKVAAEYERQCCGAPEMAVAA